MKWKKLGLVYAPTGEYWWAHKYATVPTAEVLDDAIIRVYFAALDGRNFGRIGYVDLDINNPLKVLYETREPALDLGQLGTFDDSGVNPSSVIHVDGRKYMYYIGWQRCERVPFMLFSGLAVFDPGTAKFNRLFQTPILDRTPAEPFSRSAPFVIKDGNIYKIWYWTCENWSEENGWIHYNNVIRYNESTDGINWNASGTCCIKPDQASDYAVGRPCVIFENGTYRMWYSIRSREAPTYRINSAISMDGKKWEILNDAGIAASEEGWDLR